jgi:hypothetical protein
VDDTGIPAVSIAKSLGDVGEEGGDNGFSPNEGQGVPASRQIPALSECDHPIGESPQFLGLRLGGFDPLVLKERRHEASKQRAPVFRLSAQLSSSLPMSHGSLPRLGSNLFHLVGFGVKLGA